MVFEPMNRYENIAPIYEFFLFVHNLLHNIESGKRIEKTSLGILIISHGSLLLNGFSFK